MELCDNHTALLRAALVVRGLDPHVTETPEAFEEKMTYFVNSDAITEQNYEPFLLASATIMTSAIYKMLDILGAIEALRMMHSDRCPICRFNELHEFAHEELERHGQSTNGCEFTYEEWIERAADDALEDLRVLRARYN